MYRREKQGNQKSRKGHHNLPSFSSTLLDDIYRSIDGSGEKTQDLKVYREKPSKKQSGGYRAKATGAVEYEEMTNFTRARLVEKWMEKEVGEKVKNPSLLQDNDVLFFSSTSSSSDSSGQLSSSDTEFFGSQTKPKVSNFPTRPKPVRTGRTKHEQQEDSYLFDDYKNHQKNVTEELIKSKSRAMKIYSHLKKMKQPISPGGRLTTFINALFKNENGKKVKNDVVKSSKPSSASSFSRSCMSKCSPKSRGKMRDGIQRTVRFHLDEDLRPRGQKSIPDEEMNRFGRPPLPPNALAELKQSINENNRKIEEAAQKVLLGYSRQNKDDFSIIRKIDCEEEEEDDAMSDSSSDLFELDHLSLFGNNRFCEELPVYETTHFNTNRAVAASGLCRR